jgi:hypothetical protein
MEWSNLRIHFRWCSGSRMAATVLVLVGVAWAVHQQDTNSPTGQKATSKSQVTKVALPGAKGVVMLDYIAYDHQLHRLWVPAGDTGMVDVIDGGSNEIRQVKGFATAPVELRGKRRMLGPSSVSIAEKVVYVGNRGDASICGIDRKSWRRWGARKSARRRKALGRRRMRSPTWRQRRSCG